MAYDLVLRRTISTDYSRSGPPSTADVIGVVAATCALLLPLAQRRRPISEPSANLSDYEHDWYKGRPVYRLKKTLEIPITPMSALMDDES
jgi:hypothetical protein